MSGAILIEDENKLDGFLKNYVLNERVFVFQQIPYWIVPSDIIPPIGVIEKDFVNEIFGPGTWDTLGRFTTINGIKWPVLTMKPGSIERWRFIDSAVRETIQLGLVLVNTGKSAPPTLDFHEIAVDGLALGRIANRTEISLWPGYRSDVLIKAPDVGGVYYLLVDNRPDITDPTRRYLALIKIDDTVPIKSELPTSKQVEKYRPFPPIKPTEVTGYQVAAYGILFDGSNVLFTVNGQPFGEKHQRLLTLNDVEEWTILTKNDPSIVNPPAHPFHIHVNPFEIFSIVDQHGKEQLDLDELGRPIPLWRDTVIMPPNFKIMFRTRYTDFDGLFVNHCHILDHEDQGMMELVEIQKPPSQPASPLVKVDHKTPTFKLADANGNIHCWDCNFKRVPKYYSTVIFCFEGTKCLQCLQQIQLFTEHANSFHHKNVQVIGISSSTSEELYTGLQTLDFPFYMLADPLGKAFKAFGCHCGGPLHGTFLIDKTGNVKWQKVSTKPYLNIQDVLAKIDTLL